MRKKSKKKKLVALVAVAAAVSAVALSACAKKKADENAEPEGTASESAENGVGETEASQEAKEELLALLGRVQDGVRPGAAGCSLRATSVAVEFLKWAEKNSMSTADAKAITEEFTAQTDEYFTESIALVDGAYKELRGSRAEGMLQDIGYTLIDKTWEDEPLPLVEAVMEAADQR